MKLDRKFFERDTLIVAKDLLGKYLVRNLNGKKFIGKIVETEAYIGEDDLACHASKGRTNRTEIMYGEAGHAYIYMIYGIYHCLNIVTEKEGFPAAVLIRAVEPMLDETSLQDLKKMGSGPGKLCRWMEITRELNGVDVTKSEELYITDNLDLFFERNGEKSRSSKSNSNKVVLDYTRTIKEQDITVSTRIGIDYAKHCADHPWRFYIKDSPFVSKK